MTPPTHDRLRADLEPLIREVGVSEVARRAGMQSPSISAWLAGRRSMGVDNLAAVAAAVGYDLVLRRRRG